MLQEIYDTNPSQIWLNETFIVQVPMEMGHQIVLRFDLESAETYRVSKEDIVERYGKMAHDTSAEEWKECEDMVLILASALTVKIRSVASRVRDHIKAAGLLLVALEGKDKTMASYVGALLADDLISFGDKAEKIWAPWLMKVRDYVNTL